MVIERIKDFLAGKAGKPLAVTVIAVGLITAYFSYQTSFGNDLISGSANRMFVCSETKKPFEHTVVLGEKSPVVSPYSGKATGYPAEACFWNKDGSAKTEPTYVLMNHWVHKTGATFCPDCGRLVVVFNPIPMEGQISPPTQSELANKPVAHSD